jgi:hypothetical protein
MGRPVVTGGEESDGVKGIGFFSPLLFETGMSDMVKESGEVCQQGIELGEGFRALASKALKDEADFDGTDCALGLLGLGQTDGGEQELGEDDGNETGIEFGQQALGAAGSDGIAGKETLAELADEFTLPTNAIEGWHVCRLQQGQVGEKARPVELLEIAVSRGAPMPLCMGVGGRRLLGAGAP